MIEANVYPDHIHMLVSILLKMSISSFVLKEIMRKFNNRYGNNLERGLCSRSIVLNL